MLFSQMLEYIDVMVMMCQVKQFYSFLVSHLHSVSFIIILCFTVSPTVTVSGMINITETNEIVLSCIAANSYPQTSVTWLRNNQLLVPSSAVLISTSVTVDTFTGLYTVNSTLRMLSAKPFDSGRYTCRTSAIPISNPVLQPVSDSIDVVVTGKAVVQLL